MSPSLRFAAVFAIDVIVLESVEFEEINLETELGLNLKTDKLPKKVKIAAKKADKPEIISKIKGNLDFLLIFSLKF